MRQVDRGSVPKPKSLEKPRTATEADFDRRLVDYAEDVVCALGHRLYLNKCYLCEDKIGKAGLVDRFHLADEGHPGRAFDWMNLHWSCLRCRDDKREDRYQLREEDNPDAPLTLLVDPSDPYVGPLDRLIKFVRGLQAEGVPKFMARDEVARTVEFLNGEPWHERRNRYEDLLTEIPIRRWENTWKMLRLSKDFDPSNWQGRDWRSTREALRVADRVYRFYLNDDCPFSTSIGQVLEEVIGVSLQDFKELSEEFQSKWKTLPEDDGPARPAILRQTPDKLAVKSRGDDMAGAVTVVQNTVPPVRPKRSTQRGEARIKLIAALTEHHRYAHGCRLNQDPIGNNALARKADVDKATASAFFNKEFKGYLGYRRVCCDHGRLVDKLKALNDEFSPKPPYERRRPAEEEDEGDED